MLTKCFSLAGLIGVTALVVWAGCGGDEANVSSGGNDAGPDSNGIIDHQPNPQDAGDNDTGTGPSFKGVEITYGTCPAFTKCGGDVVGTWNLTGGCLSADTFA